MNDVTYLVSQCAKIIPMEYPLDLDVKSLRQNPSSPFSKQDEYQDWYGRIQLSGGISQRSINFIEEPPTHGSELKLLTRGHL